LRQLQTQLAAWRQLAREQPVVELVRVLYEQTGLLTYAAGLPGGQQRAANLVELRERAGQFGTFRRQGLGRFLRFLEKLKDQSDLGQAAVSSEAEDVVRIVSIHRSKGLEFPIVILPDLGKGINFRSEIGGVIVDRGFGFGLAVVDEQREVQYPSLATAVVKRRLHRQTVAEEVRVLYVAMTRAKEHLILIGSAKAKQLLRWKSAEGDAAGPLPPDVVAGAKRPLDWIAPVAYRAGAGLFEIRVITAAELGSIPEPETKLTGVQQSRAELMPLEVSAATSVEAAGMIRRVTAEYAFAGATGMAAAVSVTSLVKNVPVGVVLSAGATAGSVGGTPVLRSPPLEEFDVGEVSDGGESDSGLAIKSLDLPAFFRPVALSAADRGTAIHAVLEHLKFADADSVEAITRQMDDLVKTHRLTEAERAEVNVGSILWMMQQPVGELLRSRADLVKREVPIYFDTGGGDPSDRQMVRGRIDLMVDDGNGWAIVDYKTDRVEGEQLLERAGSYAGQLQLYAEAIERVTSRPVTSATLVFLTPRVVHDVRLGRH
jgi:ATP-dependent helicase/nuclease subunit A